PARPALPSFPTRRSSDLFLDGLYRALEHFHVQGEADGLDLPALAVAEQFAGAADLQIVRRQDEAGAEILCAGDGLQALLRVLGQDRKSTRLNSSHVKISY